MTPENPPREFSTICCPSCGGQDHGHYLTGRDRDHPVDGRFVLVRCRSCGLVYQNPRPSGDRLARHYPADYQPYRRPGGPSLISRLGWQHGYEMYRRCRFVSDHASGGRLLDIGCAGGTFLAGMRSFGEWQELWGVEMDLRAARDARDRGLDVVVARAEEYELPAGLFDAVTLWDVLEHLPEPVDRLKAIRGSLTPGGVLFASVPNLGSFDSALFGHNWVGLDLPRHLQVPTPSTLRLMLQAAGFEILAMAHPSGSHYSLTASLELATRERLGYGRAGHALCGLYRSAAFKAALTPYFLTCEATGRGANLSVASRPS